jgi:hypothetical protein
MTETSWLAATDAKMMFEFLGGMASDRKRRLFACACFRGWWRALTDEQSTHPLSIAERYADGAIAVERLYDAYESGMAALLARPERTKRWHDNIRFRTFWCCQEARPEEQTIAVLVQDEQTAEKEHAAHVRLIHELSGNPFRPVTFDSSWRTPTVANLAQAIYDDRHLPSGLFDNQRLGVLADALEEAGCDNADILGHLRGGGDHVRGCWVIDQVLGKE